MFGNVLIVCHANVCRSPAAERLFRAHAGRLGRKQAGPAIEFRSAGLFAADGDDIDPVMVQLLAERNMDASTHCSRQLDTRMARNADLILVPERRQIAAVEELDPVSRGKVHLLGKWEDSEVADPHGGHEIAYRESFGLIERLVLGWLKKIC
jgi:protein-tyrosine phosphatase